MEKIEVEKIGLVKTAKDRLINGNVSLAVACVLGSAVWWLIHFYWDMLVRPVDFVSEKFNVIWLGAFLLIFLAIQLCAYLVGNYSFIDLIKWRSKNNLVKKEFFSIRLKKASAACHSDELDGHIEGYVTRSYMTKNGIRYNGALFLSGWTVVSRLREEEFIRTNKTVAQLVAFYGSAGREYVDDEEIETEDNPPQ